MKTTFSGSNNFILTFFEPRTIFKGNTLFRINRLSISNKIFSQTDHYFVFLKSSSTEKIYFHQDEFGSGKLLCFESFKYYLKEYGFDDEEIFKLIETKAKEASNFEIK